MTAARSGGTAWVETGRVFAKEDGEWLHPTAVTDRFRELVEEAGLPLLRLHDLRHGAATLAHTAGADLHSIKERAAARLVPRANRTRKDAQSTATNKTSRPSAHANGLGHEVRGLR